MYDVGIWSQIHSIIRLLLNSGAKIDDDVMKEAGQRGDKVCIRYLLEAGADVNTMLYSAIEHNREVNILFLITWSGDDVDENMWYVGIDGGFPDGTCYVAARKGLTNIVELLIRKGADVNRDLNGSTAYHKSVKSGSVECIKLIVDGGAYAKFVSKSLLAAAERGSEHVHLLLEGGVDVNIKDEFGNTPLIAAIRDHHSTKCVERLVEAGADVNTKDTRGCSLLYFVGGYPYPSYINNIKTVLRAGIKVNVRNNHKFETLANMLVWDKVGTKIAILLFAAGEITLVESSVRKVPDYLKPPAEISLKHICRDSIRKHLLQIGDVNLFVRVPQLPLPERMMSYLLYGQTLELDQ